MGHFHGGHCRWLNIELSVCLTVIMSSKHSSVAKFLGELYPKCTDAFSRHDKDDSGKIATKDIGPVVAEVFGRSIPEDQLQNQISKFIDNGDKALELPEFLSLMGMLKMQEECFRNFDK